MENIYWIVPPTDTRPTFALPLQSGSEVVPGLNFGHDLTLGRLPSVFSAPAVISGMATSGVHSLLPESIATSTAASSQDGSSVVNVTANVQPLVNEPLTIFQENPQNTVAVCVLEQSRLVPTVHVAQNLSNPMSLVNGSKYVTAAAAGTVPVDTKDSEGMPDTNLRSDSHLINGHTRHTNRGITRYPESTTSSSKARETSGSCVTTNINQNSKKCSTEHAGRNSRKVKATYHCDICPRSFESKESFEHHCRIHLYGIANQCPICSVIMDTKMSLKTHMSSLHPGPYRCGSCERTFDYYNEKITHEQKHQIPDHFECRHCTKVYKTSEGLDNHERRHRIIKVARVYPCKLCNMTYQSLLDLKQHEIVHKEENPYTCVQCGESFSNFQVLRNHKASHSSSTFKYLCSFCGRTYVNKHAFRRHETTHSSEKPFQCGHCKKFYRSDYSLRTHIKVIHAENKPFVCTSCGKKFSMKTDMKVHERVHSDARPFSCKVCGKGFKRSRSLGEHMCLHTGERPYGCDYCTQSFHSSSARALHHKIHLKEKT